jgi:Cu+-exporting ATPase
MLTAARPAGPARSGSPAGPTQPRDRADARRLVACLPLAVATAVLSLIPAAQFSGWQWLSLALATPVAVWGGWPLHRAGWLGLRRGSAPAELLASLAILAALGWSGAALLLGSAGTLGTRQPFAWTLTTVGPDTIFLSAAAGLTVTALAARYLAAGKPATPGAWPDPEPGTTSVTIHSATPNLAARDLAARDLTASDLAARDLTASDLAARDLTASDLAARDLTDSDRTRCGPVDGTAGRAAKLGPCVIAAAAATLGFWLGTGLPAAAAWGAAIAVLAAACPAGLAVPAAVRSAVRRARADLAAALGSAAAADAILAADVAAVADATLAAADPRAVAAAVELARVARAVERASLRWAVGYNVIVLPVAALGYLSPLLAGLAMTASTAVVLTGGRRLRTRARR